MFGLVVWAQDFVGFSLGGRGYYAGRGPASGLGGNSGGQVVTARQAGEILGPCVRAEPGTVPNVGSVGVGPASRPGLLPVPSEHGANVGDVEPLIISPGSEPISAHHVADKVHAGGLVQISRLSR